MHIAKKIIFLAVIHSVFWSCTTSPITIVNNTGTNIIDGYLTTVPNKKANLCHGEMYTFDYNDKYFPTKDFALDYTFTSPVSGLVEITNQIYLKKRHAQLRDYKHRFFSNT